MARMDFESRLDSALAALAAEKDVLAAEKDAENKQLRAQIAELQAQLSKSNTA